MIQRVATLTDNILAKILICYTQTYHLFIIQLLVYVKYIVLIENYFSQPTYDNAIFRYYSFVQEGFNEFDTFLCIVTLSNECQFFYE